jgi:NAD+ diphosphatase
VGPVRFLFDDPDPRFSISAAPAEGDPWLFAFRKHELVHRNGSDAPVPTLAEARAAGLGVDAVAPLGVLDGRPCVIANLAEDAAIPEPLRAASVRRLFMALEGPWLAAAAVAGQLAHFEATARFCSACARPLAPKPGDRGKRCDPCDRDVYPHVSPCVIVLVHDGPRIVLTRAARFPAGMYGLVAGFVEPGESLETCVRREVLEETGLSVDEVRYAGSQPWPFPSQLMAGFFARFTGGEIAVDRAELEDAAWFDIGKLPQVPPPISIAGHLIETYAASRR